jgi:hypothetical protein
MAAKRPSEESRVRKGEELEVQHLTQITNLSPKQARILLRKHGPDWQKLKAEAEALKKE